MRTYGGVPLVTKVQNPDEYDQPCASEEAIYQQIIDDLSYAAMNLPTRDEWGLLREEELRKELQKACWLKFICSVKIMQV